MGQRILGVLILQLFLVITGCSSDSGESAPVVPEPPVITLAKVKSFSKNSGETGETITIYGENFSNKTSDIKITFDGIESSVLSATATEIAIKLPQSEKMLPQLALKIENRTVINEVTNDYSGNIGIFPAISLAEWVLQENNLRESGGIPRIQMVNDKIVYANSNVTGGGVYRTLDGGLTWKRWAINGFNAGFYATINDEGWSQTGFGVSKIAKGGYEGIDTFAQFGDAKDQAGTPYCLYVDSDMKNGTWVSQKGTVFTTSNGVDFAKVYEVVDKTSNISLLLSTEFDNNHIWVIGREIIKNNTETRPFVLFKNNTTDGWKEYPFVSEVGYTAKEISFVDKETGFLLISNTLTSDVKLFKTTNGGDSWVSVYNGEKFTKFTFKDAKTGWAILDNKIYKTTDSGTTWTLDYTHNEAIRSISYKNNVVWAISTAKILKRFF